MRRLADGETLGCERGRPVICIMEGEHLPQCLRSVLENSPEDVPLLITGAAEELVREIEEGGGLRHDVAVVAGGDLVAAAAPGDAVLVRAACAVPPGWLDSLARAAYSDSIVASASALGSRGGLLSLTQPERPIAISRQSWSTGGQAEAVRSASLRLDPHIPAASGSCVYVRRDAIELVGAPAAPDDADFSRRCVARGLSHVAADDVLVLELEDSPPETASLDFQSAPLEQALSVARRSLTGLGVTIDGRYLSGGLSGIQVHALELIAALSRTGEARIRVLHAFDIVPGARRILESLDRVELLSYDALDGTTPRSDLFHRPYQVTSHDDLRLVRELGERVAITHHDLIAYRNPTYFSAHEEWRRFRALTRRALALADVALFGSQHSADDAVREQLVERSRAHVAYNGVDHTLRRDPAPPSPPPRHELIGERPFLLLMGVDYGHKNRPFALALLEELRERHGWPGMLVLAGAPAPNGSSGDEEAAFLASRPGLAEAVLDLPALSEGERGWLMERATALLYPTTYEGFGLIPFEAAEAGKPCLFAPQTALAEVLPEETARLVPWNAADSAERVLPLLAGDSAERRQQVEAIAAASKRFTWDATARSTLEAYEAALRAPAREATLLAREAVEMAVRYNELTDAAGEAGLALVGPSAYLPDDVRRPLLAVASRPALRRPVFAAMKLVYRIAHRNGGS